MNNDCQPNTRIPNPSARKSIHDHGSYCPFKWCEEMGRYGMKHHGKPKSSSPNALPTQKDVDEVDNVMSKFARQQSPGTRKEPSKRNSLTPVHQRQSDDSSDESHLSKSLPPYLPSYCRDEVLWSAERDHNNSGYSSHSNDLSYEAFLRLNKSNSRNLDDSDSFGDQYDERSTNDYSNRRTVRDKQKQNSKLYIYFLLSIAVLIMGLLIMQAKTYYESDIKSSDSIKVLYDESEFFGDVFQLGMQYSINYDSVLQFQSGISTISHKKDSGSFIIVYNSAKEHFNRSALETFANDVAYIAAKFLRNDSSPIRHIVLDSRDLQMNLHSELITKYRDDINKNGVMLVKEIDEVPSKLAMAFHYYCDEYNPLAEKSAIFFTLDIQRCPRTADKPSSHAAVEKCLKKKWHGVAQDNIGPLLTRVVNVIIDLSDVF